MSDIDEALEYFRRERKECERKLHGHQAIPQFTENMQKAVQHMDTAIAALERQRDNYLWDQLAHRALIEAEEILSDMIHDDDVSQVRTLIHDAMVHAPIDAAPTPEDSDD